MEVEGQTAILLELKYCERCGGLWVRPSGSEEVYCASCAIEMADVALPRKKKTAPRLPVNHNTDRVPAGPRLVVLCGQGGKA
ncbi:MAG: hypothetical protein WB421_02055 [Terriglobales bacterium]|jgi:hypothetical protein